MSPDSQKRSSLLRRELSKTSFSSGSSHEPLNPSFVQSSLDEARAELKLKSNTLQDLENERDALKASLEQAVGALESLRVTRESRESDIQSAREAFANAQEERDAYEDRFRVTCDELKALRDASITQDEVVGLLRDKVHAGQSEISRLKDELASLRDRLADVQSDTTIASHNEERPLDAGVPKFISRPMSDMIDFDLAGLHDTLTRNSELAAKLSVSLSEQEERLREVARLETELAEARESRAKLESMYGNSLDIAQRLQAELSRAIQVGTKLDPGTDGSQKPTSSQSQLRGRTLTPTSRGGRSTMSDLTGFAAGLILGTLFVSISIAWHIRSECHQNPYRTGLM